MEEPPHPPDCPCCRVVVARRGPKRTREDADLSTFLARGRPRHPSRERARRARRRGARARRSRRRSPRREDEALIHDALFKAFDAHVEKLDAARLRRIETLSFKSALEDDGKEEINADATQDEIDGLGVWLAGDEFQGDVNYRTLQKLLTRVDQRGFERCVRGAQPRLGCAWRQAPGCPHARLSLTRGRRSSVRVPRGVHEGRRARHLPRLVGDRAPGHHEALRLGDEQFGGVDQVRAITKSNHTLTLIVRGSEVHSSFVCAARRVASGRRSRAPCCPRTAACSSAC